MRMTKTLVCRPNRASVTRLVTGSLLAQGESLLIPAKYLDRKYPAVIMVRG